MGFKDFEANQVLKENVFAPGFKTENSSIDKGSKVEIFNSEEGKKRNGILLP